MERKGKIVDEGDVIPFDVEKGNTALLSCLN